MKRDLYLTVLLLKHYFWTLIIFTFLPFIIVSNQGQDAIMVREEDTLFYSPQFYVYQKMILKSVDKSCIDFEEFIKHYWYHAFTETNESHIELHLNGCFDYALNYTIIDDEHIFPYKKRYGDFFSFERISYNFVNVNSYFIMFKKNISLSSFDFSIYDTQIVLSKYNNTSSIIDRSFLVIFCVVFINLLIYWFFNENRVTKTHNFDLIKLIIFSWLLVPSYIFLAFYNGLYIYPLFIYFTLWCNIVNYLPKNTYGFGIFIVLKSTFYYFRYSEIPLTPEQITIHIIKGHLENRAVHNFTFFVVPYLLLPAISLIWSIVKEKRKINVDNLKIRNLHYKRIFTNFNFEFGTNKKIILRGSNGSGKSTLLKILTGKIKTVSANILQLPTKFGYCPQIIELVNYITVKEFLIHESMKYGPPNLIRIDALLSDFDCTEYCNSKISLLSGGTKQKIKLISLLLKYEEFVNYNQEYLYLDEPTSQMDPLARDNFFNILQRYDMHILLTTHFLEYAAGFGFVTLPSVKSSTERFKQFNFNGNSSPIKQMRFALYMVFGNLKLCICQLISYAIMLLFGFLVILKYLSPIEELEFPVYGYGIELNNDETFSLGNFIHKKSNTDNITINFKLIAKKNNYWEDNVINYYLPAFIIIFIGLLIKWAYVLRTVNNTRLFFFSKSIIYTFCCLEILYFNFIHYMFIGNLIYFQHLIIIALYLSISLYIKIKIITAIFGINLILSLILSIFYQNRWFGNIVIFYPLFVRYIYVKINFTYILFSELIYAVPILLVLITNSYLINYLLHNGINKIVSPNYFAANLKEIHNKIPICFNISLDCGEKICIVGKNGSGKSSILNILARKLPKKCHFISIDKIPIINGKYSNYLFHYNQNIITSDYNAKAILYFVVYTKNVKYGHNDIDMLANLLKIDLNQKIKHLSGGNIRKFQFLLALAYLNNDTVLLADEPTINLDQESKIIIHDILLNLRNTVIISCNDEGTFLNNYKLINI